eukprot:2508345-Pyramimonas_sp.AAC.1
MGLSATLSAASLFAPQGLETTWTRRKHAFAGSPSKGRLHPCAARGANTPTRLANTRASPHA